MTRIFDLSYEIDGDTINLEQDMGCGEVSRIDLHTVHLRLLAEEAGILAPSSNIEADRTIARLSRQLRILANRIDRLDTMLLGIGEAGHECVDEECAYSGASLELAQEFIEDLPAPTESPVTAPSRHSGVTHASRVAPQPQADKTNAARRKQQRNGASVTSPVTDPARNAVTERLL